MLVLLSLSLTQSTPPIPPANVPDPLFSFDYIDPESPIETMTFHGAVWRPDSASFALFSGRRLLVVDAETGTITAEVESYATDFAFQVRWSKDMTRLYIRDDVLDPASGTYTGESVDEIWGWEISDYQREEHAIIHNSDERASVTLDFQPYQNSIVASPDETRFWVYNDEQWALVRDGAIIARDVAPPPDDGTAMGGGCASVDATGAAWRPDSGAVAVWGFGGNTRIYDAASGAQLAELNSSGSVAWHPDGTRLTVARVDPGIYDPVSGQQIAPFQTEYGVRFASFTPDGRYVVTHGSFDVVEVWDGATGTHVMSLPHSGADRRFCGSAPIPAEISPDATRLLTWDEQPPPLAIGEYATVHVQDDGLKLRSGPGITYDVVAAMPNGQQVEVIGEPFDDGTYVWWPVRIIRGSDELIGLEGYAVEAADSILTLRSQAPITPIRIAVWALP